MTTPTTPPSDTSKLAKQFKQYHKTLNNCDHSKLTETLGNTKCCFCTKMMTVICERTGQDSGDFSNRYRDWLWTQPDFLNSVKAALKEMAL